MTLLERYRFAKQAFAHAWRWHGVREHPLGVQKVVLAHFINPDGSCGLGILPDEDGSRQEAMNGGAGYTPQSGDTVLQFESAWGIDNLMRVLTKLKSENLEGLKRYEIEKSVAQMKNGRT